MSECRGRAEGPWPSSSGSSIKYPISQLSWQGNQGEPGAKGRKGGREGVLFRLEGRGRRRFQRQEWSARGHSRGTAGKGRHLLWVPGSQPPWPRRPRDLSQNTQRPRRIKPHHTHPQSAWTPFFCHCTQTELAYSAVIDIILWFVDAETYINFNFAVFFHMLEPKIYFLFSDIFTGP